MTTTLAAVEPDSTSATTRPGMNARLWAWVKRHPTLAAILFLAL
jgi:hypothetical protein